MSAGGGGDIHGAQIPSPRWWTPFRDVPIIILAVLAVLAAIIGWTAQYVLTKDASRPAATAPSPGVEQPSSAVTQACRNPLDPPSVEPWIDGDGRAAQVWADNSDQLAGPVVLGRDGWAFYNDQIEENFSQPIGRRYLTMQEAAAWHDYFAPVAEALSEQGIEFTIQVTPSAASVYPQQLPAWTDGIIGSTPLDQLLAVSPDLPIVDFREDLRGASRANAVYTPVNSHWTDWGGYIGWMTYATCHDALFAGAEPIAVPAVTGAEETGIFNEYASYGVADATPEWTVPQFADTLADVQVTDSTGATSVLPGDVTLDLSKIPASTVTEGAASKKTALILRDSMGNALSPFWAQEYARTWQIAHRYDDWSSPPNFRALVDEYKPDVVIVQLAERHLVNAPTATGGY